MSGKVPASLGSLVKCDYCDEQCPDLPGYRPRRDIDPGSWAILGIMLALQLGLLAVIACL